MPSKTGRARRGALPVFIFQYGQGEKMIQDIHSHTKYSFCAHDTPEKMIETAIDAGIEVYGICDHNYGIGYADINRFFHGEEMATDEYIANLEAYRKRINALKATYADRIRLLCGVEICTSLRRARVTLPHEIDLSGFDYCLLENIDDVEGSLAHGDLFGYAEKLGCPVGIAHTDMFAFISQLGEDPYEYFKKLADAGIFWELNVNFDATHQFREHRYVYELLEDMEKQDIIRRSAVALSVGFDCHKADQYLPERVKYACDKIEKLGLGMVEL